MKKIVTVLLLLLAWYFAGMNRQPYVMAAVICGTIFVVLSFFLTRYLKHKLTAEIPEQSSIIRKNMQAEFKIRTDNKCRLPINKYKLTICMNYQGSNRPVIKKLSGNACPAGDPEENLASVYFAAPYCGMISAELRPTASLSRPWTTHTSVCLPSAAIQMNRWLKPHLTKRARITVR